MLKRTKRFLLVPVILTVALAATLLVVHLTSAMPAAASVSGAVQLPGGGLPVPDNTLVWLLNPDQSVRGWSQVVTSTGAFDFAVVPSGNYIIRARPLEGSGYTPSLMQPLIVLNTPVNVGTLYLTIPSITGTVFLPNSRPAPGAQVHVYAGPVEVEFREAGLGGEFDIGGLPPATYGLAAEPLSNDWLWWSQGVTGTVALSETHYVSLTLRTPAVYGLVEDGAGARVQDAVVHAVSLANGAHRVDATGPLGKFAIGDLPAGPAVISVEPPIYHAGLLPPDPITLTLPFTAPPAAPVTLNFSSSPKVVTGVVSTNNVMTPVVRNALIVASRVGAFGQESAQSDISGHYTLHLAPGLWALDVRPISTTVPGRWVYPRPPQLLHFDDNKLPEGKRLDFKVLTADAKVVGAVEMPGGGAPTFTVTVGLHTDQGVGMAHEIDADGRFAFNVPHGAYQVDVRVASPQYAAPLVDPIYAGPLGMTIIPTITLIARDAAITGALHVSGTGAAAADVPVVAWDPEEHAAFQTRSGPDGGYVVMVYTGTWLVRPAPLPNQPYLYTGEPAEITLAAGQAVGDVDFDLLAANATIHGVLLGPGGLVANDARGWGAAVSTSAPGIHNGAPVKDGEFDVFVPGDAMYTVTLRLADGGRYVYTGGPKMATAGISDTVTLTFPLTVKNALFTGALRDRRTDMAVPNLPGRVWAWGEGMALNTDINTGNGSFALPVPAGLWSLDYSIPEDSNYVKLAGMRSYGMGPNQVQPVPLPVAEKDGMLTGEILLPDSSPAVGATAVAEALSPALQGLRLHAMAGADGTFSMTLPAGGYIVRATRYSDENLVNPVERFVFVPRHGSTNVTLQYSQPDAVITGHVALTGTSSLTGAVALFAWTANGGFNWTSAELGGMYSMPVVSNTLWRLDAVYETRDQYWQARATVPVTGATMMRDLVLDGPYFKPAPVSVLFDPTEDQDIELADGTRIHIPAGAIPASGNVLLNVTPLAGAPHHQNGDVLGLTYAFEAFDADGQPITENFNQDVVIVFRYNPLALLAMGLDVNHLRPAYFSTTTNSWTAPDSFVVDEARHEIAMQIDHFTRYGILGIEGPNLVFLPVVMK